MNVALRIPRMTREEFFDWAERQDTRYEFDGFQPVAMTGGTFRHSAVCQNLWAVLRERLRGGQCRSVGPDAGVATVDTKVRYPDALVTCTKVPGGARLVPGVVVVFEVLSPGSGRTDRIDKVREYAAVDTILRYVILEHSGIGLTSFGRGSGGEPWTATALTDGDILRLPEIGIEVPVAAFYEDVDLPAIEDSSGR